MSFRREGGSLEIALRVLVHPIRRRLLESLWEKDRSFDELNRICSNHGRLGYHLRSMSEMVVRDPGRKVFRLTDEERMVWEWLVQV